LGIEKIFTSDFCLDYPNDGLLLLSREMKLMLDKEEFSRWFEQAKHTLLSAENDAKGGFFDWSCFKCQQAAEFSLKGLLYGLGEVGVGHSLLKLLDQLIESSIQTDEIEDIARKLDKFYIPTRYPDAHPSGSPARYYTTGDAKFALSYAKKILKFSKEVADGLNES